jgi:hypothetical protein
MSWNALGTVKYIWETKKLDYMSCLTQESANFSSDIKFTGKKKRDVSALLQLLQHYNWNFGDYLATYRE